MWDKASSWVLANADKNATSIFLGGGGRLWPNCWKMHAPGSQNVCLSPPLGAKKACQRALLVGKAH